MGVNQPNVSRTEVRVARPREDRAIGAPVLLHDLELVLGLPAALDLPVVRHPRSLTVTHSAPLQASTATRHPASRLWLAYQPGSPLSAQSPCSPRVLR
jgi:hypothetical protein